MVGSGYGPTEPNGNGHSGEAGVPWTTDDGGCAIQFVGRARYGPIPTLFPRTIDNGPANRYAAGTFEFEVEGGAAIPEPPTGLAAVPGDARVEISWQAPAGGSPAAGFNVYRSAAPGGPYTRLNPILIPAGVTRFTDASVEHCVEQCYVVRSVSAGGGESANSNEGCASDLCGSFRRGDVDGNGSLEITDPIAVLGNLFLGDPPVLPCFDSADVDDSGILDITDGVFSLSFQFLGGDPPPAPFPGCGVDPTVDEPGADFGCDYPAASCQ